MWVRLQVFGDLSCQDGDEGENDESLQHKDETKDIKLQHCIPRRLPKKTREESEKEYCHFWVENIHQKPLFIAVSYTHLTLPTNREV